MSKMDSISRITDILAKGVINQLDEMELKELDEWLRSSSRNQELYEKIMRIEDFEEREKLIQTIDLEKAWNKYSTRITIETKVKRILPTIWKYAAAILILAFISSLYFVFDREKPVAEIVVVDDSIKPGSKSAMLVLNNGSRIDLEQQDSLEIKEADGTKIIKKRGLVSYHSLELDIVEQELNNTIVVPRGGEYSLVLSDGTQVFVNSMSTLEFPVKFHGKEREVKLQGEACFIVTEDAEHPFIVNVNGVKVEVLGTTFNINGYSEDKKVVATLVEGKVKLNTTTNEDKHYVLLPNEQAVFDLTKNDGSAEINKVVASKSIQWVEGIYVFNNETLDNIMKTLSRWYDFNYWFEEQSLKDIRFEGGLNKYESIEPILEIIQSTGKVEVQMKGNNLLFKRK